MNGRVKPFDIVALAFVILASFAVLALLVAYSGR